MVETEWAWHGTHRPTGVAATSSAVGDGCRETCSQTEKTGLETAPVVVIRALLIMTSKAGTSTVVQWLRL